MEIDKNLQNEEIIIHSIRFLRKLPILLGICVFLPPQLKKKGGGLKFGS